MSKDGHLSKPLHKNSEASSLTRQKGAGSKYQFVQVDQLRKKPGNLPQTNPIHFQEVDAFWIQKPKSSCVRTHVTNIHLSAAEVQIPRALPNLPLKKIKELIRSVATRKGNVHY